jgi:hypothetical protein
MEYARGEGADWRLEIEEWLNKVLNQKVFNPNKESAKYLSARSLKADFRDLKKTDTQRFMKVVRGMVVLDSHEIARRSDYLICYWDRSAVKGAGTQGEVTLAKYFGKPVYLVSKLPLSKIPGWVLGCTSRTFSSFDDLKVFLQRHYP